MSNLVRTLMLVVLGALLLGASGAAQAASPSAGDWVLEGVALRPGVSADLHVRVIDNPRVGDGGEVVLAVHGFGHTAETWGDAAAWLLSDLPSGTRASRLVLLDLPGHGGSPAPSGVLFGTLGVGDYVAALEGTLEALARAGVRPTTLVGHSMGALVITLLQERLVAGGTSLRERHGVRAAVLVAPALPREVPWAFAESEGTIVTLGRLVVIDPARGPVARMSPAVWQALFFTDPMGIVAPDAPSEAVIASSGYMADEPLAAALEMLGLAGGPRPSVRAGCFGPEGGTRLTVLAMSRDALMQPGELRALYAHLRGDDGGAGFVLVAGAQAVHDAHVSRAILGTLSVDRTPEPLAD